MGRTGLQCPGVACLKRCVSLKSGNSVFDSDVSTDLVPTALKQTHREAMGRQGEVRKGEGVGGQSKAKQEVDRNIKKDNGDLAAGKGHPLPGAETQT